MKTCTLLLNIPYLTQITHCSSTVTQPKGYFEKNISKTISNSSDGTVEDVFGRQKKRERKTTTYIRTS